MIRIACGNPGTKQGPRSQLDKDDHVVILAQVSSWRHVGPIGAGFGGDAGGSPFYDLTAAKALPSAFTGKNTTYAMPPHRILKLR